jgi:glutamate synthase domain-containing protein 3
MPNSECVEIELGTTHYREINEKIREDIANGIKTFDLEHALGQRYIACAAPSGVTFQIHGTPGNDMSAYMDGATVEVFGNAQDQVGNTMNDGTIIIHGHCGDAAGYGMRGGSIFIEGDCGWRVGIHMKRYKDKNPTIFIGGNAGSFLGEYMAGGKIILLGTPGEYLATGMHGGVIYLRRPVEEDEVSWSLVQEPVDENDVAIIQKNLDRYKALFGHSCDTPASEFTRLRPKSQRPYGSMYA